MRMLHSDSSNAWTRWNPTPPRTKTFLDLYNELIAASANHMTLPGAFIPALTQLLS
jgi:hypothetical protein